MKKLICLFLMLSCFQVFCQTSLDQQLFDNKQNQKIDNESHYVVALTSSILPSALFYSWNNFILQAGWAKLEDGELREFYNRELSYDNDWVSTNFVGHPYQGSLYYMSGRNANLNMFESFAISVLGSYVWEYICEANDPSINDMAYTTIGAFALGEMLYKLSNEVSDKYYGFSYILNPINMYADLFLGTKRHNNQNNIHSLDLWIGVSNAYGQGGPLSSEYNKIIEKTPFLAKTGVSVVYNDPYGHVSKEPYDQFELIVFGGIGPGNGVTQEKKLEEQIAYNTTLFSNGVLKSYAKDISDFNEITYGFCMLYDYTWNNFYTFTSLAPGVMFNQRIKNIEKNNTFAYQLALGFNVLGITEFNYYRRRLIATLAGRPFRSYNYTFGYELCGKVEFDFNQKHLLNFVTHSYASSNFHDILEDNYTGWSFFSLNQLSYEYLISKKVAAGVKDNFYINYAIYNSLPSYFSLQNEIELYFKWYLY